MRWLGVALLLATSAAAQIVGQPIGDGCEQEPLPDRLCIDHTLAGTQWIDGAAVNGIVTVRFARACPTGPVDVRGGLCRWCGDGGGVLETGWVMVGWPQPPIALPPTMTGMPDCHLYTLPVAYFLGDMNASAHVWSAPVPPGLQGTVIFQGLVDLRIWTTQHWGAYLLTSPGLAMRF